MTNNKVYRFRIFSYLGKCVTSTNDHDQDPDCSELLRPWEILGIIT